MKSSKPPALPTWLLEHLNGGSTEALAGDLLEQFSQGRSTAWYWRQVLIAMLHAFRREWRIELMALAFTAAWAFPLYYGRLWLASLPEPGVHSGATMVWLAGLLSTTAGFTFLALGPVCFGTAMYFAMTITRRRTKLGPRQFLVGILRGCLAAALATFLLLIILPARRDLELVGNIVGTLPVFLGTLVALWSQRPYSADKGKPIFPGSPFIGT
jgi:hypothetical protein